MIPKIGETISAEQFNKLPEVGETISAEEFASLQDTTKKPDGFIKGFAKDIISPFAKVGVGGYNALLGQEGQARNLPFLGETKPVSTLNLDLLDKKTYSKENLKAFSDVAKTGFEIGTTIGAPVQGKAIATATEKLGQKITEPLAKRAGEKVFNKIVEVVSPKLTAKETAGAAVNRGTTKAFGKIKLAVDPYIEEVASTVKRLVPDFNPSKTIAENLNTTRKVVYEIADDLKQQVIKSGKDKIYTFKELAKKMDTVAKPIVIKSDKVLSRQFDLAKEAALKYAKQKGGKISDLFDARKAFDDAVKNEFPNLYDNASKPMRAAITSMRKVMNDFIADNVKDVAFKESLTNQSHLFKAIENMAEKIASGAEKEIGTTAIKRFTAKYPGTTSVLKGAGFVGGGYLGGRATGEILK